MYRKLPLLVMLMVGWISPAAFAQYVPIPNESSGTGCPGDPTQCSGYKVLQDMNNRLGGAVPIAPSYVTQTITASSATLPSGYSTVIASPTGAQTLTFAYHATGSQFRIALSNSTAYNITIDPDGADTIGGLSSWTLFGSNQAVILQDTAAGIWSIIASTSTGGSGSPGGSSGSIQYNSSGSFAGATITGLVAGNGSSAPAEYAGTGACTSNEWMTALSGAGISTCTQPAFSNISGAATLAQMPSPYTSSAPAISGANITSATIPSASLASTAVTAGSYTSANITVNAQGQVTTAANGSAGGGITSSQHSSTISTATNYALQATTITNEVFTFTATATVTLPQGTAGYVLNAYVCQNSTGGFIPSFTPIAGLTITGSFPTFTTVPSSCGDFSLFYYSATQAYLSGSQPGPL